MWSCRVAARLFCFIGRVLPWTKHGWHSWVAQLNELLHGCGGYIIGRMGLPYRARGVNIISVVLDAPQDVISTLSGRIGRLEGVSVKTQYAKMGA